MQSIEEQNKEIKKLTDELKRSKAQEARRKKHYKKKKREMKKNKIAAIERYNEKMKFNITAVIGKTILFFILVTDYMKKTRLNAFENTDVIFVTLLICLTSEVICRYMNRRILKFLYSDKYFYREKPKKYPDTFLGKLEKQINKMDFEQYIKDILKIALIFIIIEKLKVHYGYYLPMDINRIGIVVIEYMVIMAIIDISGIRGYLKKRIRI